MSANPNTTSVPTANVEAEQSLLGGLLLGGPVYVDAVADRLGPTDFYRDAHGAIFAAMVRLVRRSNLLDIVALQEELRRRGELESCGGTAYLMVLGDFVPAVTHRGVEHYAGIVLADSMRRRIFWAAQEVATLAAGGTDVSELAEIAESRILAATQAKRGAKAYRTMAEIVTEAMEEIEAAIDRGDGLDGIATGLTLWDYKIGGLAPGQLHIVAGRPGMGKSVFGSTVAVNVASQDLRVAVFSTEMRDTQIAKRMAAAVARVNSNSIRNGRMTRAEFAGLAQKMADSLATLPMVIDSTPSISPGQILSRCREIRRDIGGLDLVIVDYLQRLKPDESRRGGTRAEEVGQIAVDLKTMAGTLGVPVIALAQPNRNNEKRDDKRPVMSDLAESDGITKEADSITFLYRPGYYERKTEGQGSAPIPEYEEAEFIIDKQRDGETGTVKVLFSGPYQRFDNLSEREDEF